MTLKLVDQPSGPGPLSVLLLGVVMAIAGSSKAAAQKGPLTFGSDGSDHPCRLNIPKNCSIPELEQQLASGKADATGVFFISDEIGNRGSGKDAEAIATAVVREARRGPDLMNPGAPDHYDHIARVLETLAGKADAPDVSGIIMAAYQGLYDENKAKYRRSDEHFKRYYEAKGFGNEDQMGKLLAAYLVLPKTCAWEKHLSEFMAHNSGDGQTAPSNNIRAMIASPANKVSGPCPAQ